VTGVKQLALDLRHRPALGMEDFLVAECNREAVAWIDRWPHWPAPALTVFGPAGCGKTHLAHVWQACSRAVIVAPDALAGAEPPALLAGARCCVVEELDMGLDPASERAMLHLYNTVAERGGHVLLTARRPPSRWNVALADLASRLGAAPAVAVGRPDDALIAALLVKLFADRQLAVSEEVIAYLLPRMERSFDGARRLVAGIDRAALASRRRVTVALIREVLAGEGT
jgi:DnaA regulatory inactivator Hda